MEISGVVKKKTLQCVVYNYSTDELRKRKSSLPELLMRAVFWGFTHTASLYTPVLVQRTPVKDLCCQQSAFYSTNPSPIVSDLFFNYPYRKYVTPKIWLTLLMLSKESVKYLILFYTSSGKQWQGWWRNQIFQAVW